MNDGRCESYSDPCNLKNSIFLKIAILPTNINTKQVEGFPFHLVIWGKTGHFSDGV